MQNDAQGRGNEAPGDCCEIDNYWRDVIIISFVTNLLFQDSKIQFIYHRTSQACENEIANMEMFEKGAKEI